MPRTESEWKEISEDFNESWNFPNCLGAIDGKHIAIKKPLQSGSLYYNYKKFFSVVLMATVNANYEFIVADVGTNGRISDGGVIKNIAFGKAIYVNSLFIPHHRNYHIAARYFHMFLLAIMRSKCRKIC